MTKPNELDALGNKDVQRLAQKFAFIIVEHFVGRLVTGRYLLLGIDNKDAFGDDLRKHAQYVTFFELFQNLD